MRRILMILGLRTAIYPSPDLARGKQWYSQVLGHKPYFDEPFYVGFSVGGFELGLDPDVSKEKPGPGGSVTYWGVKDIAATFKELQSLKVNVLNQPHEVGEGIKVGSVADPFGNVIGLI